MNIQDAKAAVETLLLTLSMEHGYAQQDDGTKVEVVLWESAHPAAGVRVAEVSFSRSADGGMCGSSWMQSELGGLRACAAVERCILARALPLDDGDVEDADFNLKELFVDDEPAGSENKDEAQGTYVRQGGIKCPFCQSAEISGNSVEIDAGTASQEVSCGSCHKSWTDLYSLVGFKEEA